MMFAGFTNANTVYRATSTIIPEYEPSIIVTMEQKGGPHSRADRKLAINNYRNILTKRSTYNLNFCFLFLFCTMLFKMLIKSSPRQTVMSSVSCTTAERRFPHRGVLAAWLWNRHHRCSVVASGLLLSETELPWWMRLERRTSKSLIENWDSVEIMLLIFTPSMRSMCRSSHREKWVERLEWNGMGLGVRGPKRVKRKGSWFLGRRNKMRLRVWHYQEDLHRILMKLLL